MKRAEIEEEARRVLKQTNVHHIPIPVDIVAHRLGLRVRAAELGENVSGILVVDAGKGTIGYNSSQSEVRQRFSIAHEIGHYILHQEKQTLFIDKRYSSGVYQRNELSATGEDRHEVEANAFAAALLMPADMVKIEVATSIFDLGDEQALEELARKFNVSTQALAYRLARLGILNTSEA